MAAGSTWACLGQDTAGVASPSPSPLRPLAGLLSCCYVAWHAMCAEWWSCSSMNSRREVQVQKAERIMKTITSPLSLKLTWRPDLAGERSVGDSAGCAGNAPGAATPHSMPHPAAPDPLPLWNKHQLCVNFYFRQTSWTLSIVLLWSVNFSRPTAWSYGEVS